MQFYYTHTFFFTVLSISMLSISAEDDAECRNNTKTEAKAIVPLQQGSLLDVSEFTQIYPSAIDKKGNIQTEPILFKITKKGNGSKAAKGEMVTVHYTGCLPQDIISTKIMIAQAKIAQNNRIKVGVKFDSSIDRGQTFKFKLGTGMVIPGWDTMVADMKIGEKRIVILPANQAYGPRAQGTIPANATLIFEIELIAAS